MGTQSFPHLDISLHPSLIHLICETVLNIFGIIWLFTIGIYIIVGHDRKV